MGFNWIGKSSDGKTVTLKQLDSSSFRFAPYFNSEWEKLNADLIRMGAVLDVETTGFHQEDDRIIEIGIRQFKFNRETGELLSLGESVSAFQDPGFPLSEDIIALTGITDEMVENQKIDWNQVNSVLSQVQVVIAHNAAFDRPFIDQLSTVSPEKIWGCSLKQIDWNAKGFFSPKLELLSIYHGFFTGAHRALNDAEALLYLLSHTDSSTGKTYFHELLQNAKKTTIHMIAANSPFESKDVLKERGYRWDGKNRYWSKHITQDEQKSELEWLEAVVYLGPFRGKFVEIKPVDHFKASGN